MRALAVALALVLAACSPMVYQHGIPNLVRVDESVWRSGQISSPSGWAYLATLAGGRRIHVIKLNFNSEGSDAVPLGVDVVYVPIQPEGDQDVWDDVRSIFLSPDETNVARALAMLKQCEDHATTDLCLVHCTHGQDRTGYVVGKHRVVNDGWSKPAAYREMLVHDFHPELRGLHEAWERWVP